MAGRPKCTHDRRGKGYCPVCRGQAREQHRREHRAWLASIKVERGCVNCGYKEYAAALGFHHLDPEEKVFGLAHSYGKAKADTIREMKKCVVLCANCHLALHHEGD